MTLRKLESDELWDIVESASVEEARGEGMVRVSGSTKVPLGREPWEWAEQYERAGVAWARAVKVPKRLRNIVAKSIASAEFTDPFYKTKEERTAYQAFRDSLSQDGEPAGCPTNPHAGSRTLGVGESGNERGKGKVHGTARVIAPEDKSPHESFILTARQYTFFAVASVLQTGWQLLPEVSPECADAFVRDNMISNLPAKFEHLAPRIRKWGKSLVPYVYLSIKRKCFHDPGG